MSDLDLEAVLRERARGMVAAGMAEREIDEAIMYSDHSDRVIIWRNVYEFRGVAAAGAPSERWLLIVDAYRRAAKPSDPRPLQHVVARAYGVSPSQFRRYYQAEGVKTYADLHVRIAAEAARGS